MFDRHLDRQQRQRLQMLRHCKIADVDPFEADLFDQRIDNFLSRFVVTAEQHGGRGARVGGVR